MKFLEKTINFGSFKRRSRRHTLQPHLSLSLSLILVRNTKTIIYMCTTYTFTYTIINGWWRLDWIKKKFWCNPNILRFRKPSKTNQDYYVPKLGIRIWKGRIIISTMISFALGWTWQSGLLWMWTLESYKLQGLKHNNPLYN